MKETRLWKFKGLKASRFSEKELEPDHTRPSKGLCYMQPLKGGRPGSDNDGRQARQEAESLTRRPWQLSR